MTSRSIAAYASCSGRPADRHHRHRAEQRGGRAIEAQIRYPLNGDQQVGDDENDEASRRHPASLRIVYRRRALPKHRPDLELDHLARRDVQARPTFADAATADRRGGEGDRLPVGDRPVDLEVTGALPATCQGDGSRHSTTTRDVHVEKILVPDVDRDRLHPRIEVVLCPLPCEQAERTTTRASRARAKPKRVTRVSSQCVKRVSSRVSRATAEGHVCRGGFGRL